MQTDNKPEYTVSPFQRVADMPQMFSWKFLKDKTEYKFKFLLPYKCITYKTERYTEYMQVCAVVQEDQDLIEGDIKNGAYVVIHIPVKTFLRAWVATTHQFRKSFNSEMNLDITFRKDTKQSMFVTNYESVEPTIEETEYANNVYQYLKELNQ